MTLLFWAFLALAFVVVLLSLTGIYSVLSFTASQRTREVGIRVALGARRSSIVRLVLGEGARLIVIGLAGAPWAIARLAGRRRRPRPFRGSQVEEIVGWLD